MMCSTIWTNSARAREADHTSPLYYSAVSTWVKSNNNRFNKNLNILNSVDYSIATIDGEAADLIAKTDFPKATIFSLPAMTSISDMILNVSMGKADATFLENYTAQEFLKTNPNSIKQVGGAIRLYGNAMYVKKGEHDLRLMINDAIEETLNSELLPELFKKYNVHSNSYLMPAKSYGEGN